nr:unnamed protein product [Callosobruchus analis]
MRHDSKFLTKLFQTKKNIRKKTADSSRLSFLLAGKLSNKRCYERFTSIQCGETPLNHVASFYNPMNVVGS